MGVRLNMPLCLTARFSRRRLNESTLPTARLGGRLEPVLGHGNYRRLPVQKTAMTGRKCSPPPPNGPRFSNT